MPESLKLRCVYKLCDKGKREKQDYGVNWQHNDIFDDTGRENCHKCIPVHNRKPQRIQTAVYDGFGQKLGGENAPYFQRLFI